MYESVPSYLCFFPANVYEIELFTFVIQFFHFFATRLSPTSWTSARMHELARTTALKSSPGPPWVAATPTHIAAPLSVFLWGPPCPHTQPSLSHSLSHEMGANQQEKGVSTQPVPLKPIFSLASSLGFSFLCLFLAGRAPMRSCFGKDLIYSAPVRNAGFGLRLDLRWSLQMFGDGWMVVQPHNS